MKTKIQNSILPGLGISAGIALVSIAVSGLVPNGLLDATIVALVLGMRVNPLIKKTTVMARGIDFSAKYILRFSIVLLGLTLSFSQVLQVGKYSLIVMAFTLFTSFVGGHFLGKLFGVNWKLSSLISAGTGICGGSAIAAIAPVIEADDSDMAYAISSTFLFDVMMVLAFPLIGRLLGMSDMGFGLWAGTSINDTSSVVAAGHAFSDVAGAYAVIVKLTRTLSIIPTVVIFSFINARVKQKASGQQVKAKKVDWLKIFPFFIVLFLGMVVIKSTGVVSDTMSNYAKLVSKFCMVMALSSIGLKTSYSEVSATGYKPMIFGITIDLVVTAVAYGTQAMLGQL